jgi:small-conductance mechanosensitive channel
MELNSAVETIKVAFENSWKAFLKQVPGITLAIIIIALGFILSNFLASLFRKIVAKKSHDPLMTNFLSKVLKTLVILLAIMIGLNIAGLSGIAAGILTAAGASALILGFAFKDIGENFIAGIILSFNRPFHVNDTVKIGDVFGKVKSLEFRYTKLKTFDGLDVYIPNSDIIKKALFNYTEDGYIRLEFVVGIAYEDNIDKATQVILEAVRTTPGVVEDENHESYVAVDELAVSTVNMKVLFWVVTYEYRKQATLIRSAVAARVKEAILANGMNLPSDIKEIKFINTPEPIPVRIQKEE